MPKAHQRIEPLATYLVLGALIVGELLSLVFDEVDKALSGGGEVTLLAAAILLLFRRVDEHLESLRPAVGAVRFGHALEALAADVKRPTDVRIFANDGTKYYHLFVEAGLRAHRLEVLLCNPVDVEKWRGLQTRGLAAEVVVKKALLVPGVHFLVVEDHGGVFGLYTRSDKHASAVKVFSVHTDSIHGRELASSLSGYFEAEWAAAGDAEPMLVQQT